MARRNTKKRAKNRAIISFAGILIVFVVVFFSVNGIMNLSKNLQDNTDDKEAIEKAPVELGFTVEREREERFKKEPKTKKVAFTFDDGPSSDVTYKIMDAVEEYDGHVTFFALGLCIDENSEVLKNASERGHEIGNHSWSHKNLQEAKEDVIRTEIDDTQDKIFEITGKYPKRFRPPYAACDDLLKEICAEKGLKISYWTVDTLDWKTRDAKSVEEEILNNVKDGDTVLLHDIYESSFEGFKNAIKKLDEQGFAFVTMEDL